MGRSPFVSLLVAKPSSQDALSAWNLRSGAERIGERATRRTIMNSWKSVEILACLPPLRMLKTGPA